LVQYRSKSHSFIPDIYLTPFKKPTQCHSQSSCAKEKCLN